MQLIVNKFVIRGAPKGRILSFSAIHNNMTNVRTSEVESEIRVTESRGKSKKEKVLGKTGHEGLDGD